MTQAEQIIAHFVGDYLLQNDWMAQNKKLKGFKGAVACLSHCIAYTAVFFVLMSVSVWQGIAIFLTHYLIDRSHFVNWYMSFIGQKDFAKPPMAPWSAIMVDNTFHLLTNYIVLTLIP